MLKIKLIACCMTIFSTSLFSQIGIGTTNPHSSSILDVSSTNKGILIPRVPLTGTSDITSITSPVNSLMIYNTVTTSDVTPGFYYYENSKWVRIATSAKIWNQDGNSNIDASTDFLGTTDHGSLKIKTDNDTRIIVRGDDDVNTVGIDEEGYIGIATETPTEPLHVEGNTRLQTTTIGKKLNTADNFIELGIHDTGNRASYLNFHAIDNATDEFNASIKRDPGVNGNLQIIQNGTGDINLKAKGDVNISGSNLHVEKGLRDSYNTLGTDGQVLSSVVNPNNNKLVKWVDNTSTKSVIIGQLAPLEVHGGLVNNLGNHIKVNQGNKLTGASIILPPGSWIVNVNCLLNIMRLNGNNAADNSAWSDIRMEDDEYLWVSLTVSDNTNGTATNDLVGASAISAAMIGPANYTMLTGALLVKNSGSTNKTYYIAKNAIGNNYTTHKGDWESTFDHYDETVSGSTYFLKNLFRDVNAENFIYATPINVQ